MSPRLYRSTLAVLLGAESVVLAWNAWRFDWLRGYDAYANDLYATVVASDLRLPGTEETGVWHTPPLWFAAAGILRRAATELEWEPVQRPGQLVAATAGLAVCVIVLLLARALWPERRVLHVLAVALTATSPALVRASAMYHPETLAVAFAAGGLLVALRGLRTTPTLLTGFGAGGLLGAATLTRAWALPVLILTLAMLALAARTTRRWWPPMAFAVIAAALVGPWLANQQLVHGSALAFNREPPSGSLLTRRPPEFYLGSRVLRVFERPVMPVARNELVPQLYADWWGDWALTWDSPPPPAPGQLLEEGVVSARVRQALVGLLPTFLALAGSVGLAILAVARRSPGLALIPFTTAAVAGSYLLFAIRFPLTDGDTIKGTYVLMALPTASLAAAWLVDTLRPRGRWGTIAMAAVATTLVAAQLPFLVL